MKRLFIAGGLVGGLGLILACSEEPEDPAPPVTPRGGSTSGGSGGSTGGSTAPGGTGGSVGGAVTGGTAGTGGTGGGSPCATDCAALGQICDPTTVMCACPGYNPNHCPAVNICTDFIDDTEHCGNCDTVCGTVSACSAGLCTPDPVEVYTTAATCESLKMVIVATTIYIMDVGAGTISSLATTGGAATELVTGLTDPSAFAVDADNFYVVSGMTIDRFPLAGGAAEPVVTELAAIFDVAVDTGVLYYPVGTDIKSIDATADDGTPAATVVTTALDAGEPQSVAVDGDNVFWGASVAFNVETNSISAPLAMPIKLGASQGSLVFGHRSIQTAGTNVYWANGGQMARRAFDGVSGQETVGTTKENGTIDAFAVNATDAYWAADGNIEKGQLDMDAIWLARGQGVVGSMVVDGTSVYWSNDTCKIFKTAL